MTTDNLNDGRQSYRGVGWCAALLSSVIPGLGQLVYGGAWVSFIGLFLVIELLAIARLWIHPWFLYLSFWLLLSLHVFAAVMAARRTGTRGQSWILLVPLILSVSLTSMLLNVNGLWRLSGIRLFEIPTHSMEPTIKAGDRVIVDMRYFSGHPVQVGEPVVIAVGGLFLIKRVAAMPGQTIEGRSGVIFLDGNPVKEDFVDHVFDANYPELQNFGPQKVPPGKCFLLGDNRDQSFDSRSPQFGMKALSDIVGRPLYIVQDYRDTRREGLLIK